MAFDYAEHYNAVWRDPQHAEAQSFVDADSLAEEILLACAGGRVLDIGAGTGRLVQAFLRLGIDAYGMDIADAAVERARAVAPSRFQQGSVLALPFADASFDTVVATGLLECLRPEDVPAALAEIRRVTRRAVFLRIAVGAASEGTHYPTVQARNWWEQRAFEAGLRKHPSYYQLNDYEALEHDGAHATIVLERVPDAAAARYPLDALLEERDLHMDMFRESGSRSDAHIVRYQWAARYIRPGDAVLDAACGLGYGSYLIQSSSTAGSTLGIDGSKYAYEYAVANFAAIQQGLEFRCGMLPQALADIPDHSIDVVISFETLEHIDENTATLAEFHRILTPGGRIITSVPNDWSDASGEDPNPFHVHVYTLERLCRELEQHFVLEDLAAQTANQYKLGEDRVTWHAAGRSLRQVPLAARSDGNAPPAEWWLAVAMRAPQEGTAVPYRETAYPTFERDDWNVTAFARDYHNPWLVRAMVDIGHRLHDPVALARLAEQTARTAPSGSADAGAALCVLAYRMLEQAAVPVVQVAELAQRIEGYLLSGPETAHGRRWMLSLLFVMGKLWLQHGEFAQARSALERCVAMDPLSFSPLLCNRVVEAQLILGNLDVAHGAAAAAAAHWRAGIALARHAVAGDWRGALGDLDNPVEFGLPELASILEYASACAFALAHAHDIGIKQWWWLHPRRDRISQSRKTAKELQHTRMGLQSVQGELQRYVRQAEEFVQLLQRGAEERSGLLAAADGQQQELAAYRAQSDAFARQLAAVESHALQKEAELLERDQQAQELVRQLTAAQTQVELAAHQKNELTSYQVQAERMMELIAAKDLELDNYRAQQQSLNEQLDAQQIELNSSRAQILQMAEQINMQQKELTNFQSQLLQQSAQLQNLEQALVRSRAEHADAVVSRHALAKLSADQIADLQAELALCHSQEMQRAAEVDALTQHLLQAELSLKKMQHSSSWRVTRPLRYVSARLKRSQSGAVAAPAAVGPEGRTYAGELPHDFDSVRYLQLNPDIQAAGVDPVQHYLLFGRAEGRMFAQYPVGGRDELPDGFDSATYLELNPDVQAAGADPVEHFLLHGRAEGRVFAPAMQQADAAAPLSLDDLPHDFDSSIYLQLNPDLLAAAVEPVQHYLLYGRAEGRAYLQEPAAPKWRMGDLPLDFDGERYLQLNPDLAEGAVNPFEHYAQFGRAEGRAYRADVVQSEAHPQANLPADFDPAVYRKLHTDLADPSIDVIAHYLQFGRHEQRTYSFPAIEMTGEEGWQPGRSTVMVVSHEASRTGAPILSLNLVQSLAKRHNVVAVLLGGGPLEEAFRQSGAIVINLPQARQSGAVAAYLVEHLIKRYRFKFALVNSIVSRVMLAPLAEAFVPTISLIHEFASYTRPRDAVRNALLWSGEAVFSAKITMENAFAEYPDLGPRSAHILPQGRCLLPEGELSEVELLGEQARLRRLMRPPQAQDAVVVLGAGFVQLRKGIELFIECAARVARSPGGKNCRFVWIGTGFNPDEDVAYSVYLADQVRRAGLQQQLIFIDETAAIETAYEEADMLLLSSRLDPLPNVAIDAMASRMPVLCFDQTTGIADFLIDSGLREHCVANYLDSSELAEKVLALANDPALRAEVAKRCHEAADAYFSMARYVDSLEQLAQGVASRSEQEYADTRTIIESGLFQADFASGPQRGGETLEAQVRRYVRSWASGIDRRKPYPGFHPGIYLEQHGVTVPGADPFADYIRAGQPQGPWNYRLVEAGLAASLGGPPPLRVALHLHVYYPELLPEMLERLAHNRTQPDLFISISSAEVRPQIDEYLAAYAGPVAAVEVAPNRGRDIGPFLTAFGRRMIDDYDVIGHLHTKKSMDVKDASMGASWYRFLLENLLGSSKQAAMDDVMAAMHADESLGMVFPVDPHVVGMGANQEFALELAGQLGLGPMPEHFLFPVGSMFWTRPAALAPIISLGLEWDDYPHEPLPYDGSMLHALERLFSLSLPLSGLSMAAMHTAGVTR